MGEKSLEKYCTLALERGATHAKLIHPSSVVTAPWVRIKFQFGCVRYNKCYCCPPYSPTPEQTRAVIDCYHRAILFHLEAPPEPDQLRHLQEFSAMLTDLEGEVFKDGYYNALLGKCTSDIIINSFFELLHRKSFQSSWVDAFFKSMEMDLIKKRYETIEETLSYIYGSAEVIGLMMAKILDLDPQSYPFARYLGRAMQYINFIRDIDEDPHGWTLSVEFWDYKDDFEEDGVIITEEVYENPADYKDDIFIPTPVNDYLEELPDVDSSYDVDGARVDKREPEYTATREYDQRGVIVLEEYVDDDGILLVKVEATFRIIPIGNYFIGFIALAVISIIFVMIKKKKFIIQKS